MAEDYRGKYLALERDFSVLKHNMEYELDVAKQEHQKTQDQLHERIRFEQEEGERRLQSAMAENGTQIEGLMRDNHVFNQRMFEEESIQM